MNLVHPYLNFDGNTRDAFAFYRQVFGGEYETLMTFREMGGEAMGIPEQLMDGIAHVALPLSHGVVLMGSDTGGRPLTRGNDFYLMLDAESADEAERFFGALSEGGSVEMPLDRVMWAEKYGMCTDRFGVQWMVNFEGDARSSTGPG